MSQEALAHAAGVTKQAVSAMETGGTKNPKPLHLLAISDATGYSLRWLITGKGPKIITREAAEDMLDITALTPDSKAAIRRCYIRLRNKPAHRKPITPEKKSATK